MSKVQSQQTFKIFTVLFISTLFVFGFSSFGETAFGYLFKEEEVYKAGTAVGNVDLEGKTPVEAIELLAKASENWQANTTYALSYKEKSIGLEIKEFEFDPEATVSTLVNGRQNAMDVHFNEAVLMDTISGISIDLIGQEIYTEKLTSKLVEPASQLSAGDFTIDLAGYLPTEDDEDKVVSSITLIVNGQETDFQALVEEFGEVVLKGGSEFSFNDYLDEKKITSLDSTPFSKMATALYTAILPTNFEIIERNISKELPEYAKIGSEALVDPASGKDLKFTNPNKSDFKISFVYAEGMLTVNLTGEGFLYEYKVVTEGEETFKPKTILQYSALLKPGQVKIIEEGKEGSIIKIYREVYSQGNLLDTLVVSEDFYPPVHRVEVHALSAAESSTAGNGTENNAENHDGSGLANPSAEAGGAGTGTVPGNDTESPQETDTDNSSEIKDGHVEGDDGTGLWGKPNEQPK